MSEVWKEEAFKLKKSSISINLVASLIAFIVNISVTFFLTPYLISKLGVEAYGFVTLGTNIINYLSILTIALNSLAGRFITIELHKENIQQATKYFSTVIYANCFISIILLIPFTYLISNVELFLGVPQSLVKDVQFFYTILFMNFILTVILSHFSVGTFATDKIYLNAIRGIEANLFKAIILIVLFIGFKANIWYVGFATLCTTIYLMVFNIHYKKIFLPQLILSPKYFEIKALKNLLKSGIWNMVTHLSNLLLQGTNLIFANYFLGAKAMGILAVAVTIPAVLSSLIATIAAVFMPRLTINYAKNKQKDFIKVTNQSIEILTLVVMIPICLLILVGQEFYTLWVPSQDAKVLQNLSIISISIFIISGATNIIYNIFTVIDKIKVNAIILLITGLINVIIIIWIGITDNLNLYILVGVGVVIGVFRNLLYTIPFGAIYLNLKWNYFYKSSLTSIFILIISLTIGYLAKDFLILNTWFSLIISTLSLTVICLAVSIIIVYKKRILKK